MLPPRHIGMVKYGSSQFVISYFVFFFGFLRDVSYLWKYTGLRPLKRLKLHHLQFYEHDSCASS
jgi:hypothetical protein